jgi:hypothetical protein
MSFLQAMTRWKCQRPDFCRSETRTHDSYLFFNMLVARELKRFVASLWHWTLSANVSVKNPIRSMPYLPIIAAMLVCRAKAAFFFLLANSCIVFTHFYRMPPPLRAQLPSKSGVSGVLLSCSKIDKEAANTRAKA